MSKKHKNDSQSKLDRKQYDKELQRLQAELCTLQEWVKAKGPRVIVVFEGRDGAGKGEPFAPSPSASARVYFALSHSPPRRIGKRAKCTCSGTCSISQPPARS
jgi:hypothetical protein